MAIEQAAKQSGVSTAQIWRYVGHIAAAGRVTACAQLLRENEYAHSIAGASDVNSLKPPPTPSSTR